MRQCPVCQHAQIGDPAVPAIVRRLWAEYCFSHSNAHPGTTCGSTSGQWQKITSEMRQR